MAGKRVEFLTTILPETSRVALLSNPATVRQAVTGTEAAGRTLGIQVITLSVRNTNEVGQAFARAKNAHANGLIVDLTLRDHWEHIVDRALKNRLPTVSGREDSPTPEALWPTDPTFPLCFVGLPRTLTRF